MTSATMRPAPQRVGGTCTATGGGLAVMAYLQMTAGTAQPRLTPADRTSVAPLEPNGAGSPEALAAPLRAVPRQSPGFTQGRGRSTMTGDGRAGVVALMTAAVG